MSAARGNGVALPAGSDSDCVVRPYDATFRARWDACVEHAPDASIYNGTWWMDVMARCFPHENVSLVACDAQQQVRAVLPLYLVRGWRGCRLVSVPLRDQAGVAGDWIGTEALCRGALAVTTEARASYLAVKQGHAFDGPVPAGFVPVSHWITNEVALPLAPACIKPAALRNVRKAERNGLTVAQGAGEPMARRFYRLFLETRRRLGVPAYPESFFLALAAVPDHARFVLCSQGDRDLAGAVILRSARKAAYAYAANVLSGRELRAADLVVWRALTWASEEGLSIFDFGADSPEQTELIRFKQKWGATPRTLTYYYYLHTARRVPVQDHASAGWRFVRSSISRLPAGPFQSLSRCVVNRVD